jgi:HD-GYP domain-containing protein (c-di-GMP phosphodiesterase class II)
MITLRHHENANGTGYPGMHTIDKIPFIARVIRIIDAYDAMTTPRGDREAMKSFDAARLMTTELAPQFSQDIVKQFLKYISQVGAEEESEA